MRKSTIIFVSITSIALILLSCLIFQAFNPKVFINKHYQQFYLNTDEMEEANKAIITDNFSSYISSAYKFDGKNNVKEIGADVFVYVINKDSLNLYSDTVLLLDARLKRPWEQHIENYMEYIQPQKSLHGAMVSVPQEQISAIKKYKFLYANVDFATED